MRIPILIRKQGDQEWVRPQVTSYDAEKVLQRLIAGSPDLLPGDVSRVVVRELYTPTGGYVDLVGIGVDGSLCLVECKLHANPESRRDVVGQLVSYAASIWKMDVRAFESSVEDRLNGALHSALEGVATGSGQDWDPQEFERALEDNLQEGRFTLVLVVDEITDELKQVVEFLNRRMTGDFLALELGYVSDEGIEILLPRTYGEEISREKSTTRKKTWTERDLLEAVQQACSEDAFEGFRKLLEFSQKSGKLYWGSGATYPSVNVWLPVNDERIWFYSCYAYPSKGPVIAISFYRMVEDWGEERTREFADRLRQISGFAEHLRGIEDAHFRKAPGVPIENVLSQPGAADEFIGVLRWAMNQG